MNDLNACAATNAIAQTTNQPSNCWLIAHAPIAVLHQWSRALSDLRPFSTDFRDVLTTWFCGSTVRVQLGKC